MRNNLNLDSVLLLALIAPFIMTYRLGPGETPYWFFGVIFALLCLYLIINKKTRLDRVKNIFLWLIIGLVIGSAYFSAIVVRHRVAPVYQIHDMPLQLESAISKFLQGENPYTTTYFNTPLESWHYSDKEINPALFHFVMMPWYLLFSLPFYFISISLFGFFDGRLPLIFSLPFYFISISLFGFFDGRLPLIFLFGLLLILAWRLLKKQPNQRRLFLVLLAFNPATLAYFMEGRSDIFMFAFMFWGWYLLEKKRFFLAGVPLALAFATKQSAWPIFPFYLVFLWMNNKKNLVETVKRIIPFILVFLTVVLPFFVWEPKAFLEDTVFYLSGTAAQSYPISGYGWGMILHQLGIIRNKDSYYPFLIWQGLICLPLLVGLVFWLGKSSSVARLIFSYALFTFFFWYFSRYFNNSHLGYLSLVFLTAYFWPKNEKQ